jgi:hypothetical protein
MKTAAADTLLAKLRALVDDQLDPEERSLFAALIAPGIEQAYSDSEVEGFGLEWTARRLPDALADAVRDRDIHITGL